MKATARDIIKGCAIIVALILALWLVLELIYDILSYFRVFN
jgi:hypothetical protein